MKVVVLTLLWWAAPIVIAALVQLMTDFADHVRLQYFEVFAEGVLPVLLVSSVVEWALLVDRSMGSEAAQSRRFEARLGSLAYGVLFLTGEGLALYAIASGATSTFLVLAVGLIAIELILDLAFNVGVRITGK